MLITFWEYLGVENYHFIIIESTCFQHSYKHYKPLIIPLKSRLYESYQQINTPYYYYYYNTYTPYLYTSTRIMEGVINNEGDL